MLGGSINPQHISLPKTLEWHPWAIKTLKRKKISNNAAQRSETKVGGGAHGNTFWISGAEEKKKKRKKKGIMGGWWFELVIFGIFQRTQTCSEKNTITTKKLHQFPSVLCQWVTRRTLTYTQSHKLGRPPLAAAAAAASSLVLLLTEDAAEPIAESCNTL